MLGSCLTEKKLFGLKSCLLYQRLRAEREQTRDNWGEMNSSCTHPMATTRAVPTKLKRIIGFFMTFVREDGT